MNKKTIISASSNKALKLKVLDKKKESVRRKLLTGISLLVFIIFMAIAQSALAQTFIFNHNLWYGRVSQDVKELQKYLNNNNFPLAQSSFGSKGNETSFFGRLTQTALIKFQKVNKIFPSWGFFGPITRKLVNQKNSETSNTSAEPIALPSVNAPSDNAIHYSIGGLITGISFPVTLQNNNGDDITISPGDDSNFIFPVTLADGASYNVTIKQNYIGQKCYLYNNYGVVSGANISSVKIACGVNLYFNPFTTVIGSGSSSTPAFVCGDNLVDARDSQTYPTILIGSQCWMKGNLNYGTRIDGTNEQADASNGVIEKYCYADNPVNCLSYGALYQWHTAMALPKVCDNHDITAPCLVNNPHQGICPLGWHLPVLAEFSTLVWNADPGCDFNCDSGACNCSTAGKKLKASSSHLPIAWDGTDDYGFSVLGAGIRFVDGSFGRLDINTNLWLASTYLNNSWFVGWFVTDNEWGVPPNRLGGAPNLRAHGYSLRCIKD